MKLATYLKETRAELRHVNWPSRQQAINYTLIVVGLSVLVAALLGVSDVLFTWLLELIV